MKRNPVESIVSNGHSHMFDVVSNLAARYRAKKNKGTSGNQRNVILKDEKDIDGALKAFLTTIKMDYKQYDYSDFIKYILNNDHVYKHEHEKVEKQNIDRISFKFEWITHRVVVEESTRLLGNLIDILEANSVIEMSEVLSPNSFIVSAPIISANADLEYSKKLDNKAYEVSSRYKYSDNDMMLAIKARIKEQKLSFRDEHEYLLSGGTEEVVAIIPVADNLGSHPIAYYLDNSICTEDPRLNMLRTLYHENSFLKQLMGETLENQEAMILKKLAVTDDDIQIVPPVVRILNECKFDLIQIKNEISSFERNNAGGKRTDVFDELMPIINASKNATARILFPYNLSRSHWLTGEITINKLPGKFDVDITMHDPYGGGRMQDGVFDLAKAAVINRINLLKSGSEKIVVTNKTSPYSKPRQPSVDKKSCGVIVVEDILLRSIGKGLDRETYPLGAAEVRLNHLLAIIDEHTSSHKKVKDFMKDSRVVDNYNDKIKLDDLGVKNKRGVYLKEIFLQKASISSFDNIMSALFNDN
jgi:hypothetical protein